MPTNALSEAHNLVAAIVKWKIPASFNCSPADFRVQSLVEGTLFSVMFLTMYNGVLKVN
jgi:hypothetical protein